MQARTRGLLTLGCAIVAISSATPFIRWAQPAPAMTVAALRVSLTAVVMLAAAPRAFALWWTLPARDRAWAIAAGVLFGAHLGVWITSLYFTSATASVALVATNPVFAALFGLLLGDHVRRREWWGIAIAIGGTAIIAGNDWGAGGRAIVGDGLSLAGGALAAGYLVVGRRLRSAMPLAAYLAIVNTFGAIVLVAAVIIGGDQVFGLAPHAYVAIAGAAMIASVVGHTLLNDGVRRTPTHLVALTILGEPVGASLMTWAFFAEQPTVHAAIGGLVILAGIGLGFMGRKA
ncbi:MAG TPA: DMT family transporter [Kofleriaceae bacterium]|nr:DMT family transporter [Kofleriaceae bacterium]